MEDDPAERFAKANRVSIRALLVTDQGVDVQAALIQAGIFDPIAIPVRLGDMADLSNGLLGDGITENLMGVLEPDQQNQPDAPHSEPASHEPASSEDVSRARHQPTAVNLPTAFGQKPMAPARKRFV